MLQFLFAVPAVRHAALLAQTQSFYYNNASSLWCELGFLFHMMTLRRVQDESDGEDRVVIPSSFQRTLQQLPEAAALGLLDGNSQHSNSHQRVTNFVRFLLQQLQAEIESEIRATTNSSVANPNQLSALAPLESVFSFSIQASMTYLQSTTHEQLPPSTSLALDLVIPSRPSTVQPFGSVLWGSLRRESVMRWTNNFHVMSF
jgi:Ubiquitin carboxyl-terminal hydrolase